MNTYKEPFSRAWNRLLKNELFPNLLNNVQPIQLNIHVGTGWDWLGSGIPVDGTIITIEINEEEIIQCNYNDTHFICFVNFGKGYTFLNIPFTSINMIIIGSSENWISNPIPTLPFNLSEEEINNINNFTIKEIDDKLETIN